MDEKRAIAPMPSEEQIEVLAKIFKAVVVEILNFLSVFYYTSYYF
ncbi:MAG: hypothetical protein U9N41_07985 [Euryarchaeota archaeon]|nr:hypothetical protein [Euryarchaeota archaeon]